MNGIRFGARLLRGCAMASLWLAAAGTFAASAPQWTIIDLGGLGAFGSAASAINDRGEIVGYSYVQAPGQPGNNHAFLWSNGLMQDLGTPPGSPSSSAVALNDRTTVLGLDYSNNAYTWRDGSWLPLGVHGPADIDKSGAVTGTYTSGPGLRSYLFKDGVFRDLGTLGGNNTYAAAMNDQATVVGNSELAGGGSHAFVYDGGVMMDIGTLGGGNSSAGDVNSHGVVVGASQDAANVLKSFIWDARLGMRPLLDVPGTHYASGINDRGAVIGFVGSNSFLYDGGVLTRLETIPAVSAAGWTQLIPTDINNRGWSTGMGMHSNGSFATAFVLIPR